MSKVDSQEHPAAAQSIDHPIVKDTRPKYASADERINVLSLSAINGGDRSDASQGIDKVYRGLVHCLYETCAKSAVSASGLRCGVREKKAEVRGKFRDGGKRKRKENTYQSFQV